MQAVSLMIPIIMYPYLLKVLGKDIFGLVLYAQAVISFFVITINFGFNISATKEVSEFRHRKDYLSQIVSSILMIKAFLFLLCFLIFLMAVTCISFLKENLFLYLATYSICVGEVLFPVWYFQGIEKMKFLALAHVTSKIVAVGLIFLFVKVPSDYLLIPIFYGFSGLILGFASFWILLVYERITLNTPPFSMLKSLFRDSSGFFLSRIAIVYIQKSSLVIIGYMLGYTQVTYYDVGLKISELCKIPSQLLNQTIYPRVALTKDIRFVKKVIHYNFFASVLLYLGVFYFVDFIIALLGGKELLPASDAILILCLTIPVSGISYFLGNTILVVCGFQRVFNQSIFFEAVLFTFLILGLYLFQIVSLNTFCWVYVGCCLFEMMYRYRFVHFKKLW